MPVEANKNNIVAKDCGRTPESGPELVMNKSVSN